MRAAVYDSHRFHDGQQLSDVAKRAIVADWITERYPVFKQRYSGQLALLRLQLIELCQQKGFYPVLVELPLNLPIVGHSWDGARNTYHAGARAAAREYGIPYVDFIAHIGLVSHDFVDVSHLVEPGRVKYQARSCGTSSPSSGSTASGPMTSILRHLREGAPHRPWLTNRSSTPTSPTRCPPPSRRCSTSWG